MTTGWGFSTQSHNLLMKRVTDMTLPTRLLGTLEELVTSDTQVSNRIHLAATEKWHTNLQETKLYLV